MSMPKISVAVGTLLLIQGVGFYIGTASKSVTALIPALVGVPILVLGLLAFRQAARKHAMHAAAALATLGFFAAVARIATAGLRHSPAGVSLVILLLLTGGFTLLCIKSFVDARRRQSD
jgi:hypothetical protein